MGMAETMPRVVAVQWGGETMHRYCWIATYPCDYERIGTKYSPLDARGIPPRLLYVGDLPEPRPLCGRCHVVISTDPDYLPPRAFRAYPDSRWDR